MKRFLFLLLCTLASAPVAKAIQIVSCPESNYPIELGGKIEILEDPKGILTPEQVINSAVFRPSTQNVPNLGLSASVFWLRFHLINATSNGHVLVNLEQPNMDEVSLYLPDSSGKFVVETMGENKPFRERIFQIPDYLFRINVKSGKEITCLMRIRSTEQIQIPLLAGSEASMINLISIKHILSGLYFGIMIVMILYNLFIYFTVRDKSYLYYVVYIIIILLTQTSLQGFPFQYLWPNWTWMAVHGGFLFPALVGASGLAFLRVFLHTAEFTPRLDRVAIVFYILYTISIVLAIEDVFAASYALMEITAMLVSMYMLTMGIIIFRKGFRPAKFFLIAWTVFLVGVCIYIMKDFGVFPYNNFTRYTMQIGSAFEVILISFGLADRINILKMEKEESQNKAIQAMSENERIVKEQNVILEIKVHERTSELETANKELSETFTNLKETQSQLVDAEKMASLGQLTAGIAHEINNPINFVKSNIKSLKRTMDEVKQLYKQYEQIENGPRAADTIAAAQKLRKELDMDYSMREIDELLLGIDDGASRTSEIIKGLKVFSRLDEDILKTTDLHEGLNATLILLNTLIKEKITIEKQYGQLPPVECYPGKINQVFMNILNNAIHAILEKPDHTDARIIIHSYSDEKNAYVSIKDNGVGINPDIISRIFEPFFSTKEVGQGVGLGLSITHSIVEKHHGKVKVNSELGKGSEFIICLPLTQNKDLH
ncbi:MAG TPA: 7TM diverse intracellular signaling domain-containing protein [Bacteroidia bacterium]|jgi:signal transduction histidine kinase|nr:7TM diverse intracellular signaling domain-containing protein [Bacteroidia bacterium]